MTKSQIIAVGSRNRVKLDAVAAAFSLVWPETDWRTAGTAVPSGVSAQPMSDAEAITGASHRAAAALAASPGAVYGVGLEGGLHRVGTAWFDCGWIVVVDRQQHRGIASSARLHTPEKIMELIRSGKELGEANNLLFGLSNSKQDAGHFGLMTNGVYTRRDAYRDAVVCALSSFLHPEIYQAPASSGPTP